MDRITGQPFASRSEVIALHGMAATSQPLASQAAVGLLAAGARRHLGAWALRVALSALLLAWVMGVCDIPLAAYLGLIAYPGLALSLLRSFNEHRPAARQAARTIINEGGPLTRLLFLNNNLHALHHAQPGTAWYELPEQYRHQGAALLV